MKRHIAETSQALCRCLLPCYARILSGDAAMKERIAASPARCLLPRYARILSGDAAMKERIAASPARCLLPRYARILKLGTLRVPTGDLAVDDWFLPALFRDRGIRGFARTPVTGFSRSPELTVPFRRRAQSGEMP